MAADLLLNKGKQMKYKLNVKRDVDISQAFDLTDYILNLPKGFCFVYKSKVGKSSFFLTNPSLMNPILKKSDCDKLEFSKHLTLEMNLETYK